MFDSAKEEFELLEKLREVWNIRCMLKLCILSSCFFLNNKKIGVFISKYYILSLFSLQSIETRLRIKLPDDLPASLSDGIVLCHLVNHLRKSTIPVIHVPSSGVVSWRQS